MSILSYVRVFAQRHFEKLIACAAGGLFTVSVIQNLSTVKLNNDNEKSVTVSTISLTDYMAGADGRNIIFENAVFDESESETSASENKIIGTNSTAVSETENKGVVKAKTKTVKKNKSTYKKTGDKIQDRINSVELKPKEFLKGKDHKILKKYLNKIIDDDMTNYQKAKACYDYLINNTYYSYGGWGNAIESVLENGFGTCTEYSYVYMAMMKYLGFNAKTVDGSTAMAAGGYGYHMWVEVKLNGEVYVFDPQVEDDMSNGTVNYYRFCKTYSEVSGSYIK